MKRIAILILAVLMMTTFTVAIAPTAFAAENCKKVEKPAHKKKCNQRNTLFPNR